MHNVCGGRLRWRDTGASRSQGRHVGAVEAVASALHQVGDDVRVDGPQAIAFADVSHLATTIATTVHDDVSVVDVVDLVHPTPAVAGSPTGAAVDFIARHERHARGFYAG